MAKEWRCSECEADNYLCACALHNHEGDTRIIQKWYLDFLIGCENELREIKSKVNRRNE